MKNKLIILMFSIGIKTGFIYAVNVEQILETVWKGKCQQYSNLFQNGYAILAYELYDIDFNSYDNTFKGKMKSDINIDYTHYASVMNITGSYNPSNHEIWIYPGSIIREDYLPNGLFWVYLRVRVTLYYDSDRSGYYLMQGYTVNNNGYNESQIEFSDYPYFM